MTPSSLRDSDLPGEVRKLIEQIAPSSWERGEFHDQLPLLQIGLDSIDLVELLLSCETQFNIPFSAELLAETPLTVGRLINHVRDALENRNG